MAYENELDFAVDLAYQAGEIMRANLDSTQADWKEDNSPVTESDIKINDLVIEAVTREYRDDGVLGEESSLNPDRSRRWVVDPIDGTQGFNIGAPLSVFCLALVEEGRPVLGVIYDPYMDRLYSAVAGQGAFLNKKAIHVSDRQTMAKSYAFVSGRVSKDFLTDGQISDKIYDLDGKCFNVRSIVYGCMAVADGRAVAAYCGNAKEWDIAAAQIILEEAGATNTDLYGNPMQYDQTANGMLASNGKMHAELLALAQK